MIQLGKVAVLALVANLIYTHAQAEGLRAVRHISSSAKFEYGHAGSQTTRFFAEHELQNRGTDHICEVRYSVDGWRTSTIVPATFLNFVGNYERWTVSVGIPGFRSQVLHVFKCVDLGAKYQVYVPATATTSAAWRDSYGLELSTSVMVTNGSY